MADLVSENTEDGSSRIVQTAHPSNFDMSLNELNGAVADPPSFENLSKVFTAKYVLNVTAPDGTKIPFTYKRVDSMTLLTMDNSPIQITDAIASRVTGADIQPEEVAKKMTADELLEAAKTSAQLKKGTIQAGVISPVITDEIYEQLDNHILEVLYQAISGGVTSDAELVSHFRSSAKE